MQPLTKDSSSCGRFASSEEADPGLAIRGGQDWLGRLPGLPEQYLVQPAGAHRKGGRGRTVVRFHEHKKSAVRGRNILEHGPAGYIRPLMRLTYVAIRERRRHDRQLLLVEQCSTVGRPNGCEPAIGRDRNCT